MCSSVTFAPKSLVSGNFLEKFYLLFLPLESAIPENTRTLSGILNVYSKTKLNMLGKRKCSYKSNIEELQNSVCHLGTSYEEYLPMAVYHERVNHVKLGHGLYLG